MDDNVEFSYVFASTLRECIDMLSRYDKKNKIVSHNLIGDGRIFLLTIFYKKEEE